MTNPFEHHHITHLSPSSLLTFRANPALWCGRYLFGWSDEGGPQAMRGRAVEQGLDVWLYEKDEEKAQNVALESFDQLTEWKEDEEHKAEVANIEPMLSRAIESIGSDWGLPLARQVRVEHWIDGIEVPIIGYADYKFETFGLDLKTTLKCPSSIRPDHACQVALYSKAHELPYKVLYVTPKKFALYEQTPAEADLALKELGQIARSVRHLLSKSNDAMDAAKFYSPDFENFRWSPATAELAQEIWR